MYVYVCVCGWVGARTHTRMYSYVCMHACMYARMHACMYERMYVCMYVCMSSNDYY